MKDSAWFFIYSLFLVGSSFISSKMLTGVAFLLNFLAWVLFFFNKCDSSSRIFSLSLLSSFALSLRCSLLTWLDSGDVLVWLLHSFNFSFSVDHCYRFISVVEIDLNTINKDYTFRFKYLELSINTEGKGRGYFFQNDFLKKLSSSSPLVGGKGIISWSNSGRYIFVLSEKIKTPKHIILDWALIIIQIKMK